MMNTTEQYLRRLDRPEGRVDIILDTDTYNEIDDQFALAYILRAQEKFNLRAVCAAPFFNEKSSSPADGMEKSCDEIFKILRLAGEEQFADRVYKGSKTYLPDETTPVESPAARTIVEMANGMPEGKPLYVCAIGAITNVASALLMEPGIADKIVVVWLGGHSLEWHDTKEFNMAQDVAAARVVLGCGVAVVMLPCLGVVSHLTTTQYELEHWLQNSGKGELADYLARNTAEAANAYAAGKPWSRIIWDVSAVAWFMGEDYTLSRLIPAPVPTYDHLYALDSRRHPVRYVYFVNRDAIFEDLFNRLGKE